MNDISVEEVLKLKRNMEAELAAEISRQLDTFERATGIQLDRLDVVLTKVYQFSNSMPVNFLVSVEAKLDI